MGKSEHLRAPRLVRIGAFQNKLPLPPTTPIADQRNALYKLAENAISVASQARVNVFCFQEAWSKLQHPLFYKLFRNSFN